jgi:hypothetical protein
MYNNLFFLSKKIYFQSQDIVVKLFSKSAQNIGVVLVFHAEIIIAIILVEHFTF